MNKLMIHTHTDRQRHTAALIFFCIALLLCHSNPASASNCFSLRPTIAKAYNYYSPEVRQSTSTFQGGLLYKIEKNHFTPNVRSLTSGLTGRQPADIIFLLANIPNHPAGLDSYSRYESKYANSPTFRGNSQNDKPPYTADCMFERAVKHFGNKGEVMLVWGIHEHRNGNYMTAIEKYRKARSLGYTDVSLNYNLGLAYLESGDIEQAQKQADIAYRNGYPLIGLKRRLDQIETRDGS